MRRTTVNLPEELRLRAKERARQDGIPFAEFVRLAIQEHLGASCARTEKDPLFVDVPVYGGPVPPNLSEEHEAYLYGESR